MCWELSKLCWSADKGLGVSGAQGCTDGGLWHGVAPPTPRSVLPAGHGVECLGQSPSGDRACLGLLFPHSGPPSPGQGPRNQNRGLICRAGPYKELPVHRELSPVAPSSSKLGARISRDRHPPMQCTQVGSPAQYPP